MSRAGRIVQSNFLRQLAIAIAVIIIAIIVLESTEPFRNAQFASLAYYSIAAVGLTLLTGLNGQISLGHGALMAVGGYTTAVLLQSDNPLPFPVIALVAIITTTIVGVVVGLGAARLSGPYLAGATLALALAAPGIALYFGDSLGGEGGLSVRVPQTPVWFRDLIQSLSGQFATGTKYVAYIGWIAFAITVFFLINLTRSHVGRNWRAVRDNDVAAELAGINLGRTRVQAFVVSSVCAGLGGAVMALVVRLAAPTSFTIELSLVLLAAIVIGGLGSITGAVIGSAIVVFLPGSVTDFAIAQGMSSTKAAQLAPFLYGIALTLVILLAPAGIFGSLANAYRSVVSKRRTQRSHPLSEQPKEKK